MVLRQDPTRVAEVLTKIMSLRCALEDTRISGASSYFPGTGMEILAVGTETVQYVDTVTSIEISRDGKRLAYLAQNSYPQTEGDWSNMKVFGDLSLPMVLPERAFLQLTWTPPSYNQSGEYTCAVNGTSSSAGGLFNFEVTSEVGVQFPSKLDIVNQIRLLHLEDLANTQKLSALQDSAAKLKPPHADSGEVSCGDSTGWNQYIGSRRYVYKDVKFRQPYTDKAPVVSLGIKGIDAYRFSNLRMQLDVVNLNTRGFRVRCGTWGDTRIYSLTVRWTSELA